jgi:TolB-like protein
MPEPTIKAVFLSYASQDAAAAKKICDALRAAGVAVWFDQKELVGGDAWDQKIRRQVRGCALFIPVISANTQARREGYFRLEWKLAEDRSHLMARGTPFIVPVCVDGTKDWEAIVPDSFMMVQWTRLPEGEVTEAFVLLVRHLLDGAEMLTGRPFPLKSDETAPPGLPGPVSVEPSRVSAFGRVLRARPGWLVGAAAAIILLGAFGWMRISDAAAGAESAARPSAPPAAGIGTRPEASAKSIAVLAFANLSADKDNEYFSDGISEELCNVLGKIPGLRVPASASTFYFKGRKVAPAEIARQLNVVYLLDGSVQKDGNRVRIRARLFNARDGFAVWTSDNYDREIKDIFAVQDDIAAVIAKNLQLKLGVAFSGPAAVANPEAYRRYLLGREAWSLRTPEALDRAEQYFKAAIEVDPTFGRAHSGLVDVQLAQPRPGLGRWGERSSAELARLVELAVTALRLDPDSAEAHASRGAAYAAGWDFAASERELRIAIALNPSYASAYLWLGRALQRDGRLDEALDALRRAVELDPLTSRIIDNYSGALLEAGRLGEALAQADQALALMPDSRQAHGWKLAVLTAMRRDDEAVRLARDERADGGFFAVVALAQAGRRAEAEAALAKLPPAGLGRALALAALGRHEECVALLDPAALHSNSLSYLYFYPFLDPVRKDARFVHLLATTGLTRAHERAQQWRAAHPPLRVAQR